MTQQSLFGKGKPTFEEYDKAHPEIYRELIRMSMALLDKGVTRYGVKAIFEVIRYDYTIRKRPGDEWKCNNTWTGKYARKALKEYPQLEGFFEIRERRR